MPLTIIKGPPNSGRTEQVRQRYSESLHKRPILVVPSTDDIFDWERRLAADSGAFLGNRIMHFKDLIAEVLESPIGTGPDLASGLQRRYLTEMAFRDSWPRIAERIDRQPGLVDAMLNLIDEFRNGLVSVETLEDRSADDPTGFLSEVAGVYRKYVELLAQSGLTDTPAMAIESVGVAMQKWQGRPVFVAGFDDLTDQQLELLVLLAEETDVTIAISHEQNNPAMAVTQKLLDRLLARNAVDSPPTERPARSDDHQDLLFAIQERFMRDEAAPISPDPGNPAFAEGNTGNVLTVMRSSGRRGEAESVAGEIATLIAGGTPPGEIAIAVTSPALNGPAFRDQLVEYGIPVTLETETPADATITGQTILSLLRASSGGSAADLITFLRGPMGIEPRKVDQLEADALRKNLTTAAQAAERFERNNGTPPPHWKDFTTGGKAGKTKLIADVAKEIGQRILLEDRSQIPRQTVALETQMATAIGRACREIESIQGGATTDDVKNAISSGAIKTWAIPARNTVRIASPYSLRAKRFRHLFMVSLQERGFGEADRSGPFLSSESREMLELPEFTDPELQELYLFYSCLTVPTDGLWLSSRIADENGKAEQPSPLIDEVTRLFDESEVHIRRIGRSSSNVTFPPESAPSLSELQRSLAPLLPQSRTATIAGLDLDGIDVPGLEVSLAKADRIELSTRELRGIDDPAARALLEEADTFSATAIEAFLSCPYRWFVERSLRPERFGPDPEPMTRGNLVHSLLAGLYGAHPGVIPNPADVDEWIAEAEELILDLAAERTVGLDTDSPAHRTARRQILISVERFLRFEAGRQSPVYLPLELEASFGLPGSDKPALDMGDWKLRGSIDRIDVSGGTSNQGIVLDYKTGDKSILSWANIEKGRKVQLQLYMLAARELWEVEPVAGLYVPVLRKDKMPRGMVSEPFADNLLDLNPQKKDRIENLNEEIDAAIALSHEAVARMRSGDIEHDPATCLNHLKHAAVPDSVSGDEGSSLAGVGA